jgi:hydrogenase expression/formation protein HypC
MCLAVPGRVAEIYEQAGLTMGKIDYDGVESTACLAYLPDVKLGDYAIVHAGFAISIMDEEEAQESFKVWRELLEIEADLGTSPSPTKDS